MRGAKQLQIVVMSAQIGVTAFLGHGPGIMRVGLPMNPEEPQSVLTRKRRRRGGVRRRMLWNAW